MVSKLYIHDIVWPASRQRGINLLLQFEVRVLRAVKYEFPAFLGDPVCLTESYLEGKCSSEAFASLIDQCWSVLETKEYINNLRDPLPLACRLALSLVPNNMHRDPLELHLEWFLEFVKGVNPEFERLAEDIRREFFMYGK
ncbi:MULTISPECIES: hypothetical protein [Kordiimonas]|jgi:hypothetical protein|uniref:hypothetical protein n=1 Tax=Kordiimonas TaxID=288021 RepID=UPI00257D6CCF|nr:hypothetical protein [Kordiimonas sp. UBA4487]